MSLLTVIAYISVFAGVFSTFFIIIDLFKNPQPMKMMNIVWAINGLYLGPFGIWTYWVFGRYKRNHSHHGIHHHESEGNHHMQKEKQMWKSVFISTSHCSSGCVLGDAIGVPIVFLGGITILGSALFAHYIIEFILAYIFGVFFQLFSIVPMGKEKGNHMSWGTGFIKAVKADTISLIAFEIGMFGWMAIVHYALFAKTPEPNTMVYWFMMQIAMILGAITSYPANWILVKKGVKHSM